MKSVYLNAVGVVAPGIGNWPACRSVLTGCQDYEPAPIPLFSPDSLPANQRRRITPTIRIAMQAATEAVQSCGIAADMVATVFTTSNGDLDISNRICTALTLPERPVSPTDFHNSVHNAPAGYWTIGSHCRLPSTSISASQASFAAGLLESITQVLFDGNPVLLVAYDLPPPQVFANPTTVTVPFAAALLLSSRHDNDCLAKLTAQPVAHAAASTLKTAALEDIRLGSPAAQALLLLELLARQTPANCVLPYLDASGLLVECAAC